MKSYAVKIQRFSNGAPLGSVLTINVYANDITSAGNAAYSQAMNTKLYPYAGLANSLSANVISVSEFNACSPRKYS